MYEEEEGWWVGVGNYELSARINWSDARGIFRAS